MVEAPKRHLRDHPPGCVPVKNECRDRDSLTLVGSRQLQQQIPTKGKGLSRWVERRITERCKCTRQGMEWQCTEAYLPIPYLVDVGAGVLSFFDVGLVLDVFSIFIQNAYKL